MCTQFFKQFSSHLLFLQIFSTLNKILYNVYTPSIIVRLKLKDLVELRSAIFLFKASCQSLSKKLQLIFNFNTVNKIYNLRNKQDYQHKYVRTKQKQMCLSIYGTKLWNNIQDDIKQCNNIHSFKYKYKKYLINKY